MSETSYTRSMAVTHKDFFRILPNAMGSHPYTIEGNSVMASVDGGEVRITIGPQQVRKIALMEIHHCDVEFTYSKLSEEQYDEFRRYFELRYQRGGG